MPMYRRSNRWLASFSGGWKRYKRRPMLFIGCFVFLYLRFIKNHYSRNSGATIELDAAFRESKKDEYEKMRINSYKNKGTKTALGRLMKVSLLSKEVQTSITAEKKEHDVKMQKDISIALENTNGLVGAGLSTIAGGQSMNEQRTEKVTSSTMEQPQIIPANQQSSWTGQYKKQNVGAGVPATAAVDQNTNGQRTKKVTSSTMKQPQIIPANQQSSLTGQYKKKVVGAGVPATAALGQNTNGQRTKKVTSSTMKQPQIASGNQQSTLTGQNKKKVVGAGVPATAAVGQNTNGQRTKKVTSSTMKQPQITSGNQQSTLTEQNKKKVVGAGVTSTAAGQNTNGQTTKKVATSITPGNQHSTLTGQNKKKVVGAGVTSTAAVRQNTSGQTTKKVTSSTMKKPQVTPGNTQQGLIGDASDSSSGGTIVAQRPLAEAKKETGRLLNKAQKSKVQGKQR